MRVRAVLGIAWLLVREYVPRTGPWLVALYIAFLATSFALPAPDPASRAQMVRGFSYEAATVLALASAVFATALAIPRDVAGRRVQSIFAKPIGRAGYVIGRALGGFALCGLTLAAFWVVTVLAFAIGVRAEDNPVLHTRPADRVVQLRVGGGTSLMLGGLTAASRAYRRPHDERMWLTGTDRARFEFRGVPIAELPDPIEVEVLARAFAPLEQERTVNASVVISRPGHEAPLFSEILPIRDKTARSIILERSALGGGETFDLDVVVGVAPDERSALGFDLRLDATGRGQAEIGLREASEGFAWNLLRAYALTFLAGLIVISFAVLGSTRLTSWVSLFLAMFFFVVGLSMPFVKEVAAELQEDPAAFEDAGEHEHSDHGGHDDHDHDGDGQADHDDGEHAEPVVTSIDQLRGKTLAAIALVLPDLGHFDAPWIRKGRRIPWGLVGRNVLYALVYMTIFIAASAVSLSFRELG